MSTLSSCRRRLLICGHCRKPIEKHPSRVPCGQVIPRFSPPTRSEVREAVPLAPRLPKYRSAKQRLIDIMQSVGHFFLNLKP